MKLSAISTAPIEEAGILGDILATGKHKLQAALSPQLNAGNLPGILELIAPKGGGYKALEALTRAATIAATPIINNNDWWTKLAAVFGLTPDAAVVQDVRQRVAEEYQHAIGNSRTDATQTAAGQAQSAAGQAQSTDEADLAALAKQHKASGAEAAKKIADLKARLNKLGVKEWLNPLDLLSNPKHAKTSVQRAGLKALNARLGNLAIRILTQHTVEEVEAKLANEGISLDVALNALAAFKAVRRRARGSATLSPADTKAYNNASMILRRVLRAVKRA